MAPADVPRMTAAHLTDKATSTQEDLALVAQLVANNGRAWKLFQDRHEKQLCRSIARVMRKFHFASQEDVRDVYANLMMSLVANDYRKLRTFDPTRGRKLSSWLTMLAINSAHDLLRSSRHHAKRESLDDMDELCCEKTGAETAAIERQQSALVEEAFDKLSERDRLFADLYFQQELSPEDVASKLSIDVTTVYTKRFKLQARLGVLVHSKVA
jgi:RNA polymerase sigma-70 factor (ECF subfamily)